MPNLLRHLMQQNRLMGGEPVDPGSSAPPATPPAAPKPNPLMDLPLNKIPEDWREHARELRRENASLREKTKAIDEAAAQAKIDEAVKKAVDAQKAEAEAAREADRQASNRRIINAEIKAVAVALGIQDLDAIKLIDASKLTVDEATGEVAGVTELLEAFKTAKPYLFKEPVSTTSHTGTPPPKEKPKTFDARKATPEEIQAEAARQGWKIKK